VNTTRPTEIPVMIDPIVGVGAGSNPIIMGGGGRRRYGWKPKR
jgi:hypothetical protein